MPIKPEDILTALDIDPAKYEDVKAFTDEFSGEWTRISEAVNNKDIRSKVFGSINGALRQKAKKALAALQIDDVKVDEHDPTELLDLITTRGPEKFTARIGELEKAVSDGGKDKAAKEWEGKYAELDRKYKDLEGLHGQATAKYAELETSVKQREIDAKVNAEWERALGSVKWKQGIDDLTREGFVTRVRKEFAVRLDDTGTPYVADTNGNRIADPVKAQKFLDLPALVAMKAKEFKLDESNPHGGKVVGGNHIVVTPPKPVETDKPLRPIHVGLRG